MLDVPQNTWGIGSLDDVLNFGLCAQIFLEFAQFGLRQLLGNLRFDLVQLRQLCFTHIIDTNDVKAKLALDRCLCELAFFKFDHGIGKLRDVAGCVGPIEIATVGA